LAACATAPGSAAAPRPAAAPETGAGKPAWAAGLYLIDAHNHDAEGSAYRASLKLWDAWDARRVVLFGAVSEPAARASDRAALAAARRFPGRIVPFVAGVDIHDPAGLDYVEAAFRNGARGVGELIAASSYSPAASKVAWKGQHALDGYLPELYRLCGRWGRPVLLHIDPLDGFQAGKLREAAAAFPETVFILAHANAYTAFADLRRLADGRPNLYLDIFAGFTANPDCAYGLDELAGFVAEYPDRCLVSTDSGYGVGYAAAYGAIYGLLARLRPDVAARLAHGNFEGILAREALSLP
jgi:predicted TIM-barrel fold metal-dependent hydrolase